MNNIIVRKSRSTPASPAPPASLALPASPTPTSNIIITRKKLQLKKTADSDEITVFDRSTKIEDLHETKISFLPKKTDLTKEEMIENVIDQRDMLIAHKNQYSEQDYTFKRETIDKLLSSLRIGLTETYLDDMRTIRKKVDRIVLDKKVTPEYFKSVTDLTNPENDHKDPSMIILGEGRKFFENMTYRKPPPEVVKLDPKGKNYGNKPVSIETIQQKKPRDDWIERIYN
jgi:hypothetical protein